MTDKVTNVIIAGLGGQGAVTASDILAEAAFRAGNDVKKSEVHGMSQRGGSVASEVRYGARVFSPMVPDGEADYMIVLSHDQVEVNRPNLRPEGVLITPDAFDATKLRNRRSVNSALLGILSRHLDIPAEKWVEAINAVFPEKIRAVNIEAFEAGRAAAPSA